MLHKLQFPGEESGKKDFSSDIIRNDKILLESVFYALANRRRTYRFFMLDQVDNREFREIISVLMAKGKRIVVWDDLVEGRRVTDMNWDLVIRAVAHLIYDINFGCFVGRTSLFVDILRRMGVGMIRLDDTYGLGFKMHDERDVYGFRLGFCADMLSAEQYIKENEHVSIHGADYRLFDARNIIRDKISDYEYYKGRRVECPITDGNRYDQINRCIRDFLSSNKNAVVISDYTTLVPGWSVIPSERAHRESIEKRGRFGRRWDDVDRVRRIHERIRVAYRSPKFISLDDAFKSINLLREETFSERKHMTYAEIISTYVNSEGGEFPLGLNNNRLCDTYDCSGRGVSHVLRISLYTMSEAYARRNNLLPVIIGSKSQVVDDKVRTELVALMMNADFSEPLSVYNNDMQGYDGYEEIPYSATSGQVKLLAVDFPMLALNIDIVALGGAPGEHFVNFKFASSKRLEIVDPGEIDDELKNMAYVTHKRKKASWRDVSRERYFGLIDDIRSDPVGEKDDFWYLTIWWEMFMMYAHALMARRSGKCIAVSLKTRGHWFLPLCFFYDPIFQPFQHSQSYETRQIFGAYGPWIMNVVSPVIYRKGCMSWAVTRYKSSGVNSMQEERLLNTFVIKGMYPAIATEMVIDTFALSNRVNDRNVIYNSHERHCAFITVVPRTPFPGFWKNNGNVVYEAVDSGFEMREIVGSRAYVDNCFDIADVEMKSDLVAYDCRDIIFAYYPADIMKYQSNGFHFKTLQWCVMIGGLQPWDCDVQSIFNSQTMFVKVFPEIVRTIKNWDDDSLYDYRREVLAQIGLTPVYLTDTVAIDRSGNDVQVSGHVANMLFFAPFRVISYKRYFNVIIANLWALSHKKSEIFLRVKKMRDKGQIIERASLSFWHSPDEFGYGVDYAAKLAHDLELDLNPRDVELVKHLVALLRRNYNGVAVRSSHVSR